MERLANQQTMEILENLDKISIPSTSLEQDMTGISEIEKAKLAVNSAFALNTLVFSILKINGIPVKNHPVKSELSRTKTYFDKINYQHQKVDKDAAKRFVKAALA